MIDGTSGTGALTTPSAPSFYSPGVDASISIDRIRRAATVIDPVFLNSPQFDCEPLSARLGVTTILKVETLNPIRSFKGRGTDFLMHELVATDKGFVCASAGNFGQGMAYACRKRGIPLTVFAAHTASKLKIERMRALGAKIELEPGDFDQAKDAARRHAANNGQIFIEDGKLGAIGEGAGTMAMELTNAMQLDAVFVPLGNGSLVNGVGTWFKHASPKTRVVAVCAQGSPAMALSWKARRAVDAPSNSLADGIAVRVPVPEAVDIMATAVDEVMTVSDHDMLSWMPHVLTDAGLVVEPAATAGLAAIAQSSNKLAGQRVAAILTGGNLTEQQMKEWLGLSLQVG